ncbi:MULTISPECIES: copper resistance CopC family protein [Rhizobium]|uniref:copper resistance CopC family protein n=1 Tax=Rhizobium TaxID=379 RepID=UPI000BE94A07|nr:MULTISPECIES: copper resistance protein CopC [Rhizobium]PDS83238.1 hypothetical protein CO654_22215 [Rhizobium sp. L18]TBY45601.1 copper resistance protein CopC [Rhizobium leguminosarum bv. viciae]
MAPWSAGSKFQRQGRIPTTTRPPRRTSTSSSSRVRDRIVAHVVKDSELGDVHPFCPSSSPAARPGGTRRPPAGERASSRRFEEFLPCQQRNSGSVAQPGRFHFNEVVRLVSASATDASGDRIDLQGDIAGSVVLLNLPGSISRGTTIVSYRVASEDGHPIGGSVVFHVGTPTATSTEGVRFASGDRDLGRARLIHHLSCCGRRESIVRPMVRHWEPLPVATRSRCLPRRPAVLHKHLPSGARRNWRRSETSRRYGRSLRAKRCLMAEDIQQAKAKPPLRDYGYLGQNPCRGSSLSVSLPRLRFGQTFSS